MKLPDEIHPRPTRIDIYVDGSWLNKGKKNTAEAGGWGALVIETYPDHQKSWTPCGVTPDGVVGSGATEVHAALGGLRAVQLRQEYRPGDPSQKPEIVLHSDQDSWPSYINKIRNNPDAKSKSNGSGAAMLELAHLTIAMDAKVEYTSHNKTQYPNQKETDNAEMSIPHDLANQQAWKSRLEKQNGILHFGTSEVILRKGENPDSFIARIFPVNTGSHER